MMYRILLATGLLLAACNKEKPSTQNDDLRTATLMGKDEALCAEPQCGGWVLEMDSIRYRFLNAPERTDIEWSDSLRVPLKVEIKWRSYDNEWKDISDLIYAIEVYKLE
ncbi:MAG: hypothetical protein AAFP02_09005 [Bacteroidota bacterium]